MRAVPTAIPGCVELAFDARADDRGRFVKVVHAGEFAALGLRSDFVEQYYSTSGRGVLRGMHFQVPPHDHAKLAYCVDGEVLDAVVDLRVGSPTFGAHAVVRLGAERANAVYVPEGCAHGFVVLGESATLVYNVTSVHAPAHDAGVRWDTTGVEWPFAAPLVSPRDAALPALADFASPFTYEARA